VRLRRLGPEGRVWLWYYGCVFVGLYAMTMDGVARELTFCAGEHLGGPLGALMQRSEGEAGWMVYPIMLAALMAATGRVRWFHYPLGVAILPALTHPSVLVAILGFYPIDGGGGLISCPLVG
jgi:hypothetical protein